MSRHFQKEIDKLKRQILSLSAVVEESFHKAVASIENRDVSLAQQVIHADRRIDEMEVEVEEECLKILALHQPVALDLRYIVGVLKLNNDLERIGDLAVNLAEQARPLSEHPNSAPPPQLDEMARCVKTMLAGSLDALVNMDSSAAWRVCAADDAVDEMHRNTYAHIISTIEGNPHETSSQIHYLSVSRYLERIADHTTNIAEDVIYLTEGDIVRHGAGRQSDAD